MATETSDSSNLRNRWFETAATLHRASKDRPPRIMLAEDDDEMRRLLAGALRRDGYEVVEAKNGDVLFDMLMTQLRQHGGPPPIELIISDIRMPGLSGMDVLAELRKSDWATPFVLMTAFGGSETRERARDQGAAAFLEKPFELDDLRTVVLNLLPW